MPGLSQSLQKCDLGYLRIVAELWGVELDAPDARQALQTLLPVLLDSRQVEEVIGDLPADARLALDDLILNQGRLPWPMFTRRYGAVREMGPGRRDRDRPHLRPISAAETLWYRAFVARNFFDTSTGPQEFAYIPEDLLVLIPTPPERFPAPLGRAATPAERAHLIPASDSILDHACTLLAALRLDLPLEQIDALASSSRPSVPSYPLSSRALKALLSAASLLDVHGLPLPDPARAFLEASRGAALAQLVRAWLESSTFGELRLIPGLSVEGELEYDPLRSRRSLLGILASVPGMRSSEERPYWSLPAFLDAVRTNHPDFLRPAGDYDSWFIRHEEQGVFLRGFEHWDEVDGAFLRFMLSGPLHWLGVLDLASPVPGGPVSAFRFSTWAGALLSGEIPQGLPVEDQPIQARSDARLVVPRLAPRAVRYLLARFCSWEAEKERIYHYRLTPGSLARAHSQGLTIAHLLTLLRRYAQPLPPSLVNALERWDQKGTDARLEKAVVLRLSSPDLLNILRASPAARFLGDPLGPTTVVVKAGAEEKVLSTLAEMGYLGDSHLE